MRASRGRWVLRLLLLCALALGVVGMHHVAVWMSHEEPCHEVQAAPAGPGVVWSAGTGAGHGGTSTSAGKAEHNEQDMAFVQGMIPHHQQAVEMATMATKRATDPKVKDLATRIEGAQDPEIKQMSGMLDQRTASMGSDMPTASGMPGMDHGSMQGAPPPGDHFLDLRRHSRRPAHRPWQNRAGADRDAWPVRGSHG